MATLSRVAAFDDVADELYSALPKDFVRIRAAQVAAAKQAGDKELAKQIGALRRPATAAWLVNLLVREAGAQIEALLDLGAAMRRAQVRLSATELRQFTVQRQQVIRALAARAHTLAAEHGEQVSRDVLHQVQDTLSAALADPELSDQVRAGRLVTPLAYSGFGPAGLTLVRSSPEPAAKADGGAARKQVQEQAQAERERQLAEAKQAADLAARAVVRADRAVVSAAEALARADRELARAEQSVAEREAALAEARASQERASQRRERAADERAEAGERQATARAELQHRKRRVTELTSESE